MTTREVHQAVKELFGNYDHKIFNSYLFDWESDFFAISKSGYSVEVEVKISKADFKKDFTHKTEKHKIFAGHKRELVCIKSKFGFGYEYYRDPLTGKNLRREVSSYIDFVKPVEKLPNKFFYACPEGLLTLNDIPGYAGLIYIQMGDIMKPKYWIVKQAPFLHKKPGNFTAALMQKYHYRNNEVYELLWHFKRKHDLTESQLNGINHIMGRLH